MEQVGIIMYSQGDGTAWMEQKKIKGPRRTFVFGGHFFVVLLYTYRHLQLQECHDTISWTIGRLHAPKRLRYDVSAPFYG